MTKHITGAVRCRTMFATHYHTLCEDFDADPHIALGHMVSTRDVTRSRAVVQRSPATNTRLLQDCLVEEGADGSSAVTFLYKYADGACPKSYGLNVAQLAKLPESVTSRAALKSLEFETVVEGERAAARDAEEAERALLSADWAAETTGADAELATLLVRALALI